MRDSVDFPQKYPILCAIALAFGPAIALGISRFSYTLFLPLMREDLHWSYFTSGNMNTGNAVGYFIGALTCNSLFKRYKLTHVFFGSIVLTILLIIASGLFTITPLFFMSRLLVGVTCTWVFVSGGALAAQLGARHPQQSGWILGIFYGGVGFGILLSSIFVNTFHEIAQNMGYEHPWQEAWWGMALVSSFLGLLLYFPVRTLTQPIVLPKIGQSVPLRKMLPMNTSYFFYGLGHIGYMTFVVALIRDIGFTGNNVDYFYGLVGIFMMLSSKIWSKLLDKKKDGFVLGSVAMVLAIACFIPAMISIFFSSQQMSHWQIIAIFISAMLFGSSMVTAVSATTAFVKHNLPPEDWVYGIRVFTIAFSIGQIFGPFIVGLISDAYGSLGVGLLFSGVIMFISSMIGYRQKSLASVG